MNDMTDKSTIRLAEVADYPADQILELPSRVSTGQDFMKSVDLVDIGIGETVPQGSLFSYLFRRFGNPNTGSDPSKDLASYLVTTTHSNMLLQITPYAGGDASISFRFMAPLEVIQESRSWLSRHRDAHEIAFHDWIEAEGRVPEWADDAVDEMARSGYPMRGNLTGWRRMMDGLLMLEWKMDRENKSDSRVDWLRSVRKDFEAIHPTPGLEYRDPDWTKWDDADPFKPYAEAMIDTLADLKRPVWIRDVLIDPWGRVRDEELPTVPDEEDPDCVEIDETFVAPAAASAGYPAGDLSNQDPEAFAALHARIVALGDGDAALGMERALELLPDAHLEQGGPTP